MTKDIAAGAATRLNRSTGTSARSLRAAALLSAVLALSGCLPYSEAPGGDHSASDVRAAGEDALAQARAGDLALVDGVVSLGRRFSDTCREESFHSGPIYFGKNTPTEWCEVNRWDMLDVLATDATHAGQIVEQLAEANGWSDFAFHIAPADVLDDGPGAIPKNSTESVDLLLAQPDHIAYTWRRELDLDDAAAARYAVETRMQAPGSAGGRYTVLIPRKWAYWVWTSEDGATS